ncbi:hypothetical protein JVU11DRAFT_8291 [Chiua virens]|nr:hypothetical protein JVU11DRAFT_8291 [Chiua virens]
MISSSRRSRKPRLAEPGLWSLSANFCLPPSRSEIPNLYNPTLCYTLPILSKMRSFVSVLISVALASFIGAAPMHGNHPATVPDTSVPSKLPSGLQSSNPAVGGQLGSVVGEVKNPADVRDFKPQIEGAVNSIESKLNARTSTTASVPTILANLTAEMESCAAAMNYVNPMNITATLIEVTFLGMNNLVNGAICALEELVGETLAVILPAMDGADAANADSQVADSVLNMFDIIYNAAESAYENADTQSDEEGGKGSGKNKATRSGSGDAFGTLIGGTLPDFTAILDSLIPGLDTTSFLPMFSPFESSTSEPLSGVNGRSKYALLARDDTLVCN